MDKLTAKLVETISDPDRWTGALAALCKHVRADKALISIRDRRTAHIVIPQSVAERHNSPLIYGFTEEEVGAYLEEYQAIDPWTAIERANHPYYPYALSQHISPKELLRTAFADWLRPQGISDTVVAEIGVSGPHWASLNLYFDGSRAGAATGVRDRLKDVLPIIQTVWRSGRELQLARIATDSASMVINRIVVPAVTVDAAGRILVSNALFDDLAVTLTGRRCVPGTPLILAADVKLLADEGAAGVPIRRTESGSGRTWRASLSCLAAAELHSGEAGGTYLVQFLNAADATDRHEGTQVWEAPALTARERTLVRLLAEGSRPKDAETVMGVTHARVMQLWKSARTKLNLEDLTALRVAHQTSQAAQSASNPPR